MTQNTLSNYGPDDSRAQHLVEAIQSFVDAFVKRQEAGELLQLLEGEILTGGAIEQKPEDFTEHELIEPCLDALGYSDPQQSHVSNGDPQFRRQPTRYPKVEQKQPDYELRNVHDRLTCIVEVKTINREPLDPPGKATSNIAAYLEHNTFAKYAYAYPRGVLVGIGTDGFRWVLWLKDLETGEVYEDVQRTCIRDAIARIAASELPEQAAGYTGKEARLRARSEVKNHLVASFSRENLVREVAETVDRFH